MPRLWFPHMDKFIHAGEFAVLALFCFRAAFWPTYWRPPLKRLFRTEWAIAAACGLFALLDEIHQAFVSGRSASPWDWLADMTGVALILAFCHILSRSRESAS